MQAYDLVKLAIKLKNFEWKLSSLTLGICVLVWDLWRYCLFDLGVGSDFKHVGIEIYDSDSDIFWGRNQGPILPLKYVRFWHVWNQNSNQKFRISIKILKLFSKDFRNETTSFHLNGTTSFHLAHTKNQNGIAYKSGTMLFRLTTQQKNKELKWCRLT